MGESELAAEVARLRRKFERERRARLEAEAIAERFTRDALHDPLTGLANRTLFHDRVEHALLAGRRETKPLALLLLDLDGFKEINDSLGHEAGDALLARVAERLRGAVRSTDTVARLGGDEFALLLEETDLPGALLAAERISGALRTPLSVAGRFHLVTGSLGLVSASGEESAQELLRNADVAMYMAKGRGKACFAVFEPSMHASALVRLELKAELQRALERGEFLVHYQPIVKLSTGRISGVEALVRWNHPTRDVVAPAEFIPLAEETGLIVPLGWWVLGQACRQAHIWQARFPSGPALTMSVNVSMRQLHDPAVVERVTGALSSGIAHGSLILEITESGIMRDPEWSIARLRDLKELGLQVAIDNFGTGYSSLAYLQRLPVDILKIDKSFVAGVAQGSEESALAHAIIRLGAAMQLQVVAEGVDERDQLAQLRALGCGAGQGYYFTPPLDVSAMGDVLGRMSFPERARGTSAQALEGTPLAGLPGATSVSRDSRYPT